MKVFDDDGDVVLRPRPKKSPRHSKTLPKVSHLEPKTENQSKIIAAHRAGSNIVINGMAGTGKTFVALSLALQCVEKGHAEGVAIYRSAVPTRDMGFMPGTRQEKEALYEIPYRTIAGEIYQRADAYDLLKKDGVIEFSTTSYLRGLTIRNSVILVDEAQNCDFGELDTLITRVGEGSRIMIIGDFNQMDTKGSGFEMFMNITKNMKSFDHVEMTMDDVVRSDLVKEYLIAKAKFPPDLAREYINRRK